MGPIRQCKSGRACPLCPGISDINLFRYRKRIIYLDAEVSDGAFDFCVARQELHGPQIAGSTTDQRRLVRRNECVPKSFGSSPMPVNRKSPGFLPAAFK
jgi:hypothetical protein